MMRVIGGRLADEVDVDVTGGLAAGRRLPVKVGAKKLEARVLDVGHPENGLGQPDRAKKDGHTVGGAAAPAHPGGWLDTPTRPNPEGLALFGLGASDEVR
jgi:hypothetical protein